FLPLARRAGADGALRRVAEDGWKSFCHLRVVQERTARRASQLD
ncbi:hypothetical protein A2U01_0110124, partial [Trifolium medium]|nr:hypothetical protein [Trifolium medium]